MSAWLLLIIVVIIAGALAFRLRQQMIITRRLQEEMRATHKDLREQIVRAEAMRAALLKAIDDVLLVLDADQRILFANPAAENLLGSVIEGETLIGAMREPELEMLIEDAQRLGGEGVERRIEYDQHILHARASVFQNGDARHHPFEILSLRDVTEMQRLERARREMVSNIIHELSTPITNISLLIETILGIAEEEKLKPKRVRKQLTDIQGAAETLTHLMQEMRELSLIESGHMPIRLTPTNLREIIVASHEQLQTLASTKEQTIELDAPDDVYVLADELRIQRAFNNILHNAVKFTRPQGKITVTVSTSGDEAIIAIRDNGPGIPKDEVERIYERFYQVDKARREGTGLGLAMVRHIALAHGGRTWVESTEGEGATFFVALVLAESPVV